MVRTMHRRAILCGSMGVLVTRPLFAMLCEERNGDKLSEAAQFLASATAGGQVRAAVLYARVGKSVFHQAFGDAKSVDAFFVGLDF